MRKFLAWNFTRRLRPHGSEIGRDMVRDTSIEAYRDCLARGLITKWQYEVLVVVLSYPKGITQGECWSRYFAPEKQRHDICPRFAELKKKGLITEIGKRPCGFSKKSSYAWVGTGAMPKTPEKKPSKEVTAYQRGFEDGRRAGIEETRKRTTESFSQGRLL